MMKKIELEEQKKLLVDLLKYITKICDENDIKYSLIGGSLIGAIRHKGIIPWDDDIDIILMPNDYDKLMDVLKNTNHYYVLLNPKDNDKYYYPFAKLVDSRTKMQERGVIEIDDYGVYVDIFKYHYVSNNEFLRKLHYKRLFFIQTLFARSMLIPKKEDRLKTKLIISFAKLFGPNYFKKRHMSICNNSKKTGYLLSNWPAYGYKKEIQKASYMTNYKKVPFENIKAMISNNYDDILKTTFGNYMELPPEDKRVLKHNTEIYWK